jgi:chromosome segregation ATPase
VITLSEQNAQQGACARPGQGVIKNASEELGPKQLTYEDLMNQLHNLEKQIRQVPNASYGELVALKKKIADFDKEIVKRSRLRHLSKKISELSKHLQQLEDDGDSEGEETKMLHT